MKIKEDKRRCVAFCHEDRGQYFNQLPKLMSFIFFYLLLSPFIFFSYAQDETPDIDEWQVMKVEAAKDPFAHGDLYKWDLRKMPEGSWDYPLHGCKVISPYGGKRHHGGVDLKTRPNDSIHVAFDGEVVRSGPFSGYGNCVIVKHANGLETLYSHQSKNLVKTGEKVRAGQVIGLTGRTGRATTEHLHLETKFNGRRFNPIILFDHANHSLQQVTLTFTRNGNVSSSK